ncbi:DUF397 domain-containing protein [Actinosynnema sp. CS-041913]|uniref:DUF397 domain-containing protein n=1 Tax=Actinosynnema sp. CS-041913 TaxID=3239917 RepID=UPI003D943B3C
MKSSASGSNQGDCLEIARSPDWIMVRSSRNRQGERLMLTCSAWRALLAWLRSNG